jgi:hypothetical protein
LGVPARCTLSLSKCAGGLYASNPRRLRLWVFHSISGSFNWESKPFLRKLYRLATITVGESYPWEVTVPDMSKHDFIRESIRDNFQKKNLSLAKVMTDGFHSSLRNAFAHSEYYFDNYKKGIKLDTYKGASWDIEFISFDDWAKRFAYSLFLNYHIQNHTYLRRVSIVQDLKKDDFLIIHPRNKTCFGVKTITYDQARNAFLFGRIAP